MSERKTRARNLVLGALVADAAAMGLHWLYDQDRIKDIAPEHPEFLEPSAENFAGVPGYFAHAGRSAGDQSQYGEQALVMLRALVGSDGAYDAHQYATAFRSHFGYGGVYVGYIDRATRETLDNFRRVEDMALAKARAIPFNGDGKVTQFMVTNALALIKQTGGADVKAKFEDTVRRTHSEDAVLAYGFEVLEAVAAMDPVYGAIDEQLPAISKLPPLVATYSVGANSGLWDFEDAVTSAVRTTSDHPRSIAFGTVCSKMMRAAVEGAGIPEVIAAGQQQATPEIAALLDKALTMTGEDNAAVTKHFGMACDLTYGVPSAVHNIATATSFTDGTRRNIYGGGDMCGRATLVGAVLGAVHGVGGDTGIPEAWIDRLACHDAVEQSLDALLAG